jgi:hypothetical protein
MGSIKIELLLKTLTIWLIVEFKIQLEKKNKKWGREGLKNTFIEYYMPFNIVLTKWYMFIVWLQIHRRLVENNSLGLYYYCLALSIRLCILYDFSCQVICISCNLTIIWWYVS